MKRPAKRGELPVERAGVVADRTAMTSSALTSIDGADSVLTLRAPTGEVRHRRDRDVAHARAGYPLERGWVFGVPHPDITPHTPAA